MFESFAPVCFLTRSSGSSTRCCRSVWCSVVSSLISHEKFLCGKEQPGVCIYTSSATGISLANLKAWRRAAAFVLLASNLVAALYTGLIHQRGTLDVMSRLQTLCDVSSTSTPSRPDVLLLMPCHSTPFYRYGTHICHTWVDGLQMSCMNRDEVVLIKEKELTMETI